MPSPQSHTPFLRKTARLRGRSQAVTCTALPRTGGLLPHLSYDHGASRSRLPVGTATTIKATHCGPEWLAGKKRLPTPQAPRAAGPQIARSPPNLSPKRQEQPPLPSILHGELVSWYFIPYFAPITWKDAAGVSATPLAGDRSMTTADAAPLPPSFPPRGPLGVETGNEPSHPAFPPGKPRKAA